jgi:guanylate kinase
MSDKPTGLIIVVSAPSGGGEQHGVDYFFLSREEFQQRIATGDFLEHAEYNGHYYGTPRRFLEEQLTAGRDVLLDIEVQGAGQVIRRVRHEKAFAYPEALVTIFLMPPSLELLETRLRRRGTDSDETIRKRLALAQQEMAHWREYDYVILSGHLDDDFERGKAILIAEKCRTSRQPKDKPWQQSELSF